MAMSPERRPFPGGWGPYFGAALPGFWIAEGGQSATGALLDHVIRWHGAGGEPSPARHREIAERIMALRAVEGLDLAGRLHVLPDFHGNRSPLADPHALGVISGLTLDASFDSLCRLYWRTAVAIALGVRHIVETLKESGYASSKPCMSRADTRKERAADGSLRRRRRLHGHGARWPTRRCCSAPAWRRRRRPASTTALARHVPACGRRAAGACRIRTRAPASTATTGYSWRCTGIGRRSTRWREDECDLMLPFDGFSRTGSGDGVTSTCPENSTRTNS